MALKKKRSRVDAVEEELARQILFRESPDEVLRFASVRTLAGRMQASSGGVREALQRLHALGLITFRGKAACVSAPLHTVQSIDSLVLAARCMTLERHRVTVFTEYTTLLRRIAAEGAGRVLSSGRARAIEELTREVSELVGIIEGTVYDGDLTHQLHYLAWFAASRSHDTLLQWAANALDRAFPFLRPWLEEGAFAVRNPEPWRAVLEALQARDTGSVAPRVRAALEPYHRHVLSFARLENPRAQSLQNLATPPPELAAPRTEPGPLEPPAESAGATVASAGAPPG